MDGPILSIQELTKLFGESTAVDRLDLEVRAGEVLALLGPSGCGKTTTLRMIAGLERPSAGRILFRGAPVVSVQDRVFLPANKRNFGMVFQSYALWPHMTVFNNVAYPLRLRRVRGREMRERVGRVLELMELSRFSAQQVHRLSGGQQQRVALARALVYEPALVLFDEPFSNLDAQLRTQMRVELKALQKKLQMTAVFVTHDQLEALSIADRIAIMRAGRIEQIGPPSQVYDRPATRFVRDFLGRIMTLSGVVRELGADGALAVELDGAPEGRLATTSAIGTPFAVGQRVEVAARPEHVRVCPAEVAGAANGTRIAGVIEDLLFTGESFESRIRVGGESVLLHLARDGGWCEGQKVLLEFHEGAAGAWPSPQP